MTNFPPKVVAKPEPNAVVAKPVGAKPAYKNANDDAELKFAMSELLGTTFEDISARGELNAVMSSSDEMPDGASPGYLSPAFRQKFMQAGHNYNNSDSARVSKLLIYKMLERAAEVANYKAANGGNTPTKLSFAAANVRRDEAFHPQKNAADALHFAREEMLSRWNPNHMRAVPLLNGLDVNDPNVLTETSRNKFLDMYKDQYWIDAGASYIWAYAVNQRAEGMLNFWKTPGNNDKTPPAIDVRKAYDDAKVLADHYKPAAPAIPAPATTPAATPPPAAKPAPGMPGARTPKDALEYAKEEILNNNVWNTGSQSTRDAYNARFPTVVTPQMLTKDYRKAFITKAAKTEGIERTTYVKIYNVYLHAEEVMNFWNKNPGKNPPKLSEGTIDQRIADTENKQVATLAKTLAEEEAKKTAKTAPPVAGRKPAAMPPAANTPTPSTTAPVVPLPVAPAAPVPPASTKPAKPAKPATPANPLPPATPTPTAGGKPAVATAPLFSFGRAEPSLQSVEKAIYDLAKKKWDKDVAAHKKWEEAAKADASKAGNEPKVDDEPKYADYVTQYTGKTATQALMLEATDGKLNAIPTGHLPAAQAQALGAILLRIEKNGNGTARPDVTVMGADNQPHQLEPKELSAWLQETAPDQQKRPAGVTAGMPVDAWAKARNVGLTALASSYPLLNPSDSGDPYVIETAKGQRRVVSNGVVTLPLDGYYGGIDNGTHAADGDIIDVYISTKAHDMMKATPPKEVKGKVFVMQQMDKGKDNDELKIGIGYDSAEAFVAAMASTWDNKQKFVDDNLGKVVEMTWSQYYDKNGLQAALAEKEATWKNDRVNLTVDEVVALPAMQDPKVTVYQPAQLTAAALASRAAPAAPAAKPPVAPAVVPPTPAPVVPPAVPAAPVEKPAEGKPPVVEKPVDVEKPKPIVPTPTPTEKPVEPLKPVPPPTPKPETPVGPTIQTLMATPQKSSKAFEAMGMYDRRTAVLDVAVIAMLRDRDSFAHVLDRLRGSDKQGFFGRIFDKSEHERLADRLEDVAEAMDDRARLDHRAQKGKRVSPDDIREANEDINKAFEKLEQYLNSIKDNSKPVVGVWQDEGEPPREPRTREEKRIVAKLIRDEERKQRKDLNHAFDRQEAVAMLMGIVGETPAVNALARDIVVDDLAREDIDPGIALRIDRSIKAVEAEKRTGRFGTVIRPDISEIFPPEVPAAAVVTPQAAKDAALEAGDKAKASGAGAASDVDVEDTPVPQNVATNGKANQDEPSRA